MSASIRDVARLSGFSIGTVSNALNRPDEVPSATRERIQRAVQDLGYVPNNSARALRLGSTPIVGFVVMNGQNPFFTDVVRGAEDEASGRGIAILYGNTDEDPARERKYLELFEAQRVRGILIAPFGDVTARLRQMASRGIRSVLIDHLSNDNPFSSVSVDNRAGGEMAVEHLIAQGYRTISVVGAFGTPQVDDRLAGARAAAKRAATPVEIRAIPIDAMTVADGVASGRRLLGRARRFWPDAIFAGNDLVALGILQALVTDGRVRVPHDIAVMGFDDIPFAAAAAVPLSSIRQPSRMMGRTALRTLLEEASDDEVVPRNTIFHGELVVRASTRRPG